MTVLPEQVGERSRRARWVVGSTILLGLTVVYWFRGVFGPLLVAMAIAYIVEPLVVRLVRRGWSRLAAVSLVFFGGTAIAVSLLTMLAVQGISLASSLAGDEGWIRRAVARVVELFGEVQAFFGETGGGGSLGDPEAMQRLITPTAEFLRLVVEGTVAWFGTMGAALLAAVYLFYIMLELPTLWHWASTHLPRHDRERTLRVFDAIHLGMAAFLRGRVVIAVLKGAVLAAGLLILGTEAGLFLGFGAGFLSILPIVGPLVGFVAPVLVTLANQEGLMPVFWVSLVFLIGETIEGLVLLPWVMRGGVSLHPLTVLFCVMFWGAAFGVFGALCAIPLTLVLKILLREYVLPSVDRLAE